MLLPFAVFERVFFLNHYTRIRKLLKKAMKLPKRELSSFLYTGMHHGGLGLTSMEDTLDVTNVNKLVRCLSSPDKKVQDVAWDQLPSVVRKRKEKESITNAYLQEFLNTPPVKGEYRQEDVKSLWSNVCRSIKNLRCEVSMDRMEVKISEGEATVYSTDKKAV